MSRVRMMLAISIGFTIASAVMFAVAGIAAGHLAVPFLSLVRDGATAEAVIAAMCWLEWRRDRRDGEERRMRARHERREEALMRTVSSLAGAPAEPVRQLHSA